MRKICHETTAKESIRKSNCDHSTANATRDYLHPALETTIQKLKESCADISDDRKQLFRSLSDFASDKVTRREEVRLNFIYTHNSRRSDIAQWWAQAAAHYYHVPEVRTYSGGTEATAFNPRNVEAMQGAGFEIVPTPTEKIRYMLRPFRGKRLGKGILRSI